MTERRTYVATTPSGAAWRIVVACYAWTMRDAAPFWYAQRATCGDETRNLPLDRELFADTPREAVAAAMARLGVKVANVEEEP